MIPKALLEKLPTVAFIDNSHDKSPGAPPVIAVNRGESGYIPVYTPLSADVLNAHNGVTPLQARAMHIGSTLGWDAPGADPDVLAKMSH